MGNEKIRQYIDLMNANDVKVFELEQKDFRVRIEKHERVAKIVEERSDNQQIPLGLNRQEQDFIIDAPGICIKAPLVGIFYDADKPGGKPFVKIGQRVKKGDQLCIIESMKVMNKITAPEDGVIEKCLIQSGNMVQYDEMLFVLATEGLKKGEGNNVV